MKVRTVLRLESSPTNGEVQLESAHPDVYSHTNQKIPDLTSNSDSYWQVRTVLRLESPPTHGEVQLEYAHPDVYSHTNQKNPSELVIVIPTDTSPHRPPPRVSSHPWSNPAVVRASRRVAGRARAGWGRRWALRSWTRTRGTRRRNWALTEKKN